MPLGPPGAFELVFWENSRPRSEFPAGPSLVGGGERARADQGLVLMFRLAMAASFNSVSLHPLFGMHSAHISACKSVPSSVYLGSP